MNEHGYIRSIHRKLPSEVYKWKINDNYAGGVADAYYSGPVGDLWIEYKFVKLPKHASSKVNFGASAQQQLWLSDRIAEGRNVLLVIGSECGALLTNDVKLIHANSSTVEYFLDNAIDSSDVVKLICDYTISSPE